MSSDADCFAFKSNLLAYDPVTFIGGVASVCCYLYLCYMYFVVHCPVFLRHPTTLVVYKSLFEMLFVQQFLWLPFLQNKDNYYFDSDSCKPKMLSRVFSFITEFSFLGGETMFFLICWDLRLSYTNPFASFSKYNYLAISALLGGIVALALVLTVGSSVGPSSEGVLWIQNVKFDSNNISNSKVLLKFFFFYLWMLIIYSYSIWAVWVLSVKLKEGFAKSLGFRLQILTRTQQYAFLCTLYWSSIFLLQFLTVFTNLQNGGNVMIIDSLVSYVFAYRGCYVLFTIIYVNRDEASWLTLNPFQSLDKQSLLVSNVVQEGLLMKPHLNLALRTEVLYFTTSGIIYAAQAAEELVNPKMKLNPNIDINEFSRDFKYKDESIIYTFNERKDLYQMSGSHKPSLNMTKSSYVSEMIKIQEMQKNKILKMNMQEAEEEAENMGLLEAFRNSTISERSSMLQDSESSQINKISSLKVSSGRMTPIGTSTVSKSDAQLVRRSSEIESSEKINSSISISDSNNNSIDIERGVKQSEAVAMDAISENQSTDDVRSSYWSTTSSVDIGKAREATINDRSTSQENAPPGGANKTGVINSAYQAASFLGLVSNNPGFTLEDFCPLSFRKIRLLCGINSQEYCDSFSATSNEVVENKDSSGSFLFFSKDQKYISKSVKEKDLRTLIKILPHYMKHLQVSPHTFIVKVIGAHCITMYGQPLYFIVMKNVFPLSQISERYELKGSWVDRHAVMEDMTRIGTYKQENLYRNMSGPLYYDNDIMQKVSLNPVVARNLAAQIRSDVAFLQEKGLMDYSLLVGIKRLRYEVLNDGANDGDNNPLPSSDIASQESSIANSQTSSGGFNIKKEDEECYHNGSGAIKADVIEGPGLYYIGIVDIFQEWTLEKRLENLFNQYILRQDGEGITSIDPFVYSKRFYKRCVEDLFEGLEDSDMADNLYNYKYTNNYGGGYNSSSNSQSHKYESGSDSFMEYSQFSQSRRTDFEGNSALKQSIDGDRYSSASSLPRYSESLP